MLPMAIQLGPYPTDSQKIHTFPSALGLLIIPLYFFAVVDFSGAGTILPRLGMHGLPGGPDIRVSRALLSVKDKGGWKAVENLLPTNMRDPLTIREVLTEGLTKMLAHDSNATTAGLPC